MLKLPNKLQLYQAQELLSAIVTIICDLKPNPYFDAGMRPVFNSEEQIIACMRLLEHNLRTTICSRKSQFS